jgi:hypothetical protein
MGVDNFFKKQWDVSDFLWRKHASTSTIQDGKYVSEE